MPSITIRVGSFSNGPPTARFRRASLSRFYSSTSRWFTSARQLPRPLTAAAAASDVERLSDLFPILQPTAGLVGSPLSLARTLGVLGRRVFDLVLAATMLENGVTTIYTYDDHFANIPGVVSLRPSAK